MPDICFKKLLGRFLINVGMVAVASAQTTSLALSSGVAVDAVASLALSLDASAGVAPAAIQWSFKYPSAALIRLTIEDGPTAAAAGKTVICTGDGDGCTCLVLGLNAEIIADGVIARITAVLAPGVNEATILITEALGVSAIGDPLSLSSSSGTVTITEKPLAREPRGRPR
jgi:hypothetical protein